MAVILAQSLYAQDKEFKVSGKITGFPPTSKIKIGYNGPRAENFYKDSVDLVDGTFVYQGKMVEPHLINFYFDIPYQELTREKRNGFALFLDGSSIHISADRESLSKATITGSPATQQYQDILKGTDLFDKLNDLAQKSNKAWVDADEMAKESTKKERANLMDSLTDYLFARKGANKSQVVAYFVNNNLNQMETDRLEKAVSNFAPNMQSSLYIQPLVTDIQRENRLKTGKEAPAFTLLDTAGKSWSLSDFKGKYLLLDFGASWCGWCKLETPFLLDVYKKYSGKNFGLINIAMDTEQELWKKDIEKENYPWLSISDLKGWKGALTKDYNIKGVPEIILIDPEGRIIERGLRGTNIDKLISKYL